MPQVPSDRVKSAIRGPRRLLVRATREPPPIEIASEPPDGLDSRFCEVMDAAPVMIWVSGKDKWCIWFNRPWLTFTGRSMAQERGNGWAEGVHSEDFDCCLKTYVSCFDARKEFRMQYRLRRHDGTYRWVDDTGIPRYGHDGTFLGYIGSCTDIHELRETQDELRRRALEVVHLNRTATTGALSASVAHELNQPLTAIQSNTDAAKSLLAARVPDLEEVKEILADIGEDTRRAASIIQHLRLLLKRRSETEVQQFDLNDAIADTLLILRPETMKRGVVLSVKGDEQCLPVRVDKILLEQVLLNLVMNGMDAVAIIDANAGKITISAALIGAAQVEVAVTDTGPGIPNDKLESIFEAFYTTKPKGTGLGLSIARTIVETYGGKIWAENRAGGGAAFRFTLPLAGARPV